MLMTWIANAIKWKINVMWHYIIEYIEYIDLF